MIFVYHGYPLLIHRLTYRRTNHNNLHVRGYQEEGTATRFDMSRAWRVGGAVVIKKIVKMPVVGSVMTSFPHFVEVADTVNKMERMMDEHGIRHLPVQDRGKVIGIVSERDLHHYVKREAPDAEKETIQARHIMIPDPYIVPFRAPLNEVVREMAKRRIGSVIVQRHGKLAGILSAIDVCRILGEYLESMFPGGRRGGDTAA